MNAAPRLVHKPVIDASGNWTTAPHLVWRDATGMHDRPATIDALRDIPALIASIKPKAEVRP